MAKTREFSNGYVKGSYWREAAKRMKMRSVRNKWRLLKSAWKVR